jgi:hypothetical protein
MLHFPNLLDVLVPIVELRNGFLANELLLYILFLPWGRINLLHLQGRIGNNGEGLIAFCNFYLGVS